MNRHSFWHYYTGVIARPAQTFNVLKDDANAMKYGLLGFLIPGIGYTLFYFMASSAGGSPTTFKPWLALPIEKYFFYDIFLALPGYFLSFIATTSVVYLLSKLFKSSVTYDILFSVIGMSIGIASWSTMLHDLTDAFLAFVGVIDMKAYEKLLNEPTVWRSLLLSLFVIYFAWFFFLFFKGVKTTAKLSTPVSLLIGLVALVVYQGILLIFIR